MISQSPSIVNIYVIPHRFFAVNLPLYHFIYEPEQVNHTRIHFIHVTHHRRMQLDFAKKCAELTTQTTRCTQSESFLIEETQSVLIKINSETKRYLAKPTCRRQIVSSVFVISAITNCTHTHTCRVAKHKSRLIRRLGNGQREGVGPIMHTTHSSQHSTTLIPKRDTLNTHHNCATQTEPPRSIERP